MNKGNEIEGNVPFNFYLNRLLKPEQALISSCLHREEQFRMKEAQKRNNLRHRLQLDRSAIYNI